MQLIDPRRNQRFIPEREMDKLDAKPQAEYLDEPETVVLNERNVCLECAGFGRPGGCSECGIN